MKPAPFDYRRPGSLDEALACMSALEDARPLAGGQSLVPMMNFRLVTPTHVVDLNRVPELVGIRREGHELLIGAMTRQQQLAEDALVHSACPLIKDALRHVGHRQTRNRGTIGGSLANLDPAAELPAALAACEAVLEVRSRDRARQVPMSKWCRGYMTPDLSPDELLCRIRIPVHRHGEGHAFEEVARRRGDFAIAAAAVLIEIDTSHRISRCAIALAGVSEGPVRPVEAETMLRGKAPGESLVREASRHAAACVSLEDAHVDRNYRKRIATVVTRRAIQRALERAMGFSSADGGPE